MAQRIVSILTFSTLFLLAAGAVQATSQGCADPGTFVWPGATSGDAADQETLPFLTPEPVFLSTICIPPDGKVTCSAAACHTCQVDATCNPTQTADHFRVYRNNDSASHCCTLNGYINGYPQCQGGPFSWMTFGHWTKQCNCV
jgi:hypothetical protein